MVPPPGRFERTALVLCDVEGGDHEVAPHAPRSILRGQVDALDALAGFTAMAASEVEYFMYKETYEAARVRGWHFLLLLLKQPSAWDVKGGKK